MNLKAKWSIHVYFKKKTNILIDENTFVAWPALGVLFFCEEGNYDKRKSVNDEYETEMNVCWEIIQFGYRLY